VGEDRTSERSRTEQDHRRRVTVAEAAELLGITAEAVRTRIKRGKLESVKDPPAPGGTVYVLLEADQTRPNIDPTSQGQDQTTDQTGPSWEELVEEIHGRLEDLRVQLEEERKASAELRRIVAALTQRIPEIEAPRGEREWPTETAGWPERGTSPESQRGTEQPQERRGFWPRLFGG
jgi:hypothetical protein